ncbi:MAG: hypothetical protein M3256_15795 [Actinomycetota bacterium]|nr:hypothetical protein [Actinomycetota bacterium]
MIVRSDGSPADDSTMFTLPDEFARRLDERIQLTMAPARTHIQTCLAESLAPIGAAVARLAAVSVPTTHVEAMERLADNMRSAAFGNGFAERLIEARNAALAPMLQSLDVASARRDAVAQEMAATLSRSVASFPSTTELASLVRNSPEVRAARSTEALERIASDQLTAQEAQAALLSALVSETHGVSARVTELTDKVAELEQAASEVDARRHKQLILVAMVAVLFGFLLSHFFG